jgi:hypothetical protein
MHKALPNDVARFEESPTIPAWPLRVAYLVYIGITLSFMKPITLESNLTKLKLHIRKHFVKLDLRQKVILGQTGHCLFGLDWDGPLEYSQASEFINDCANYVQETTLKRSCSSSGMKLLVMIDEAMNGRVIESDWDRIVVSTRFCSSI